MSTKAYSYLRFSTPEQAKGDSRRRQMESSARYADLHDLVIDDTLTFHDLGVSAFRGKNAEVGGLAAFRRAVEDGRVAPGSVLLIENLDRLSRQSARKALTLLNDIVDSGIEVVTTDDGQRYTAESLDKDVTPLLLALMTFVRGNQESAKKSERVRAAWDAKRATAAERPTTAVCPAWLSLDRAAGRFVVVEDRAALVRRMFDMTAQGAGLHAIANALNAEGVPTWGSEMHPKRRPARLWSRGLIAFVLDNPAVVGTLRQHVVEHVDGRRVRRQVGEVPGYFPAIVEGEVFRAVQASRTGDHKAHIRAGFTTTASILAGLAECPVCGGTMTRVSKGSRQKAGKPRLVCVLARAGKCAGRSVRQEDVEAAIVASADEIAGAAPIGGGELQAEIDNLDAAMDHAQSRLEAAFEVYQESRSEASRQRLRDLEAQVERDRAALADMQSRRANAVGSARRLSDFVEAVRAEPMDRAKVNALLRQVVRAVVVDAEAGMLGFRWAVGGAHAVAFAMPKERAP